MILSVPLAGVAVLLLAVAARAAGGPVSTQQCEPEPKDGWPETPHVVDGRFVAWSRCVQDLVYQPYKLSCIDRCLPIVWTKSTDGTYVRRPFQLPRPYANRQVEQVAGLGDEDLAFTIEGRLFVWRSAEIRAVDGPWVGEVKQGRESAYYYLRQERGDRVSHQLKRIDGDLESTLLWESDSTPIEGIYLWAGRGDLEDSVRISINEEGERVTLVVPPGTE